MNNYVELVYAQNWVEQAFEMHWSREEDEDTVTFMDLWSSHRCGTAVWENRHSSISNGNNVMCR